MYDNTLCHVTGEQGDRPAAAARLDMSVSEPLPTYEVYPHLHSYVCYLR